MNKEDRKYFIKLILCVALAQMGITLLGVMALIEYQTRRIDRSAKVIMEWSKKADVATEILDESLRIERMKESYERQGIKATEENINPEE